MRTDVLGYPYEQLVLDLGYDWEGPVVATLVRRLADNRARRAVLWIHGMSDYFFHTHVADWFVAQGFNFYALDLRKYGRSLRAHQTPNFCRSLDEYLPELDLAAELIRADGHDHLLVAAHSTGGLIASLWAQQRAGTGMVSALFLNSPFFDLPGTGLLRRPAEHVLQQWGRRRPYQVLPRQRSEVYGHSLHVKYRGEWSYDLRWKPLGGFPVRLGWLAAVREGQRRLHRGLGLDIPVLVACSTRSFHGVAWDEAAWYADAVLDVEDIARWAPRLGNCVTLVRIEGGMHDLTLSRPAARTELFRELARWTSAYVGGVPVGQPAAHPARATSAGARRVAAGPRTPHRTAPASRTSPGRQTGPAYPASPGDAAAPARAGRTTPSGRTAPAGRTAPDDRTAPVAGTPPVRRAAPTAGRTAPADSAAPVELTAGGTRTVRAARSGTGAQAGRTVPIPRTASTSETVPVAPTPPAPGSGRVPGTVPASPTAPEPASGRTAPDPVEPTAGAETAAPAGPHGGPGTAGADALATSVARVPETVTTAPVAKRRGRARRRGRRSGPPTDVDDAPAARD